MKRTISFLLALLLTVSMIPNVFAQEEIPGIDYDSIDVADFAYTVDNEEATITGYSGAGGNIMLPSELGGYPVTAIGEEAFYECESLTAASIPDSVITIGDCAFDSCANLETVEMADSVTTIGNQAFAYCSSLTDVYYNGTQEQWDAIEIGEDNDCLLNATLHTFVQEDKPGVDFDDIDVADFTYTVENEEATITGYTGGDSEITIPAELGGYPVTAIGEEAFWECNNLTAVTIPDSVIKIGNAAFYCLPLTSVEFGAGVEEIGQGAFAGCSALTAVVLPDRVAQLGEGAFNQCTNLQTVSFGTGISSIGYAAFYGCTALTDVYYDGTPEQWGYVVVHEENECLLGAALHLVEFTYDVVNEEAIVTDYLGDSGDVVIPATLGGYRVVALRDYLFSHNTALTSVVIADSVTDLGEGTFEGCENLSTVKLPSGLTVLKDSVFSSCSALSEISIPATVTTISARAFWYSGLTSVTIPASVTELSNNAFGGCESLESIRVDANNQNYCSDDKGVLFNKAKTTLIKAPLALTGAYEIPATVKVIGQDAFEYSKLETVTIPNGVETIEREAFNGCEELTAVVIPDSVTTLNYKAFSNNPKLASLTIGSGVKELPTAVFHGDSALTSVVIPDGVEIIGEAAFAGCTGLTQITIPASVTQIGIAAFASPALADVYYAGTQAQWDAITMGEGNELLQGATIHYNYGSHTHSYVEKVTKPTCTAKGYTTYTCDCGDSYKANETKALGHTYKSGSCTRCKYKPAGAKITTQPVNVAVSSGKTAKVTVKASGTGLKYVWYMAKKGSSKFTKTTVTSSSYSVKMSSSVNGQKVYCQITDAYGNVVKSSTVTLYKGTAAKITTQPKGITVVNAKTGKLTIKASGSSLKYTWYVKYKGASSFTKVGSSSKTYSFKMASKFSGAQAYCVVKDKYGISVKSSVVTIKLAPVPKITIQPKSVLEVNGKTVKFSVKASGEGLKYQWYYAKKGSSSFKKLSSAKSATYSVKVSSSVNGRKYYCLVTDKYGQTVKSSAVTLTLKTVAKITTQPKSVTVVGGSTAKLTVKAVGDGAKYTWYYLKKGATKYTKSSITATTFSVKMADTWDGAQVYCAVSDKYGNTVKSTVVTIKQAPKPKITTQPKSVLEVSGKTVKFSVKASGEGLKYQWYYAKKGSSSFKKLSGKTSATYSVKVSSSISGRKYYCLVTDKYGQTVKSSAVTLTLKTVAKITTQPKSVTVSSGKTAKFTVKAVGDGVDYVWFVGWPNSEWEVLTWGTNTVSFKTTKDMNGLLFMCCAVDKYENVAMSKEVKLTVK